MPLPVRVVIVDDHPVVHSGLWLMLLSTEEMDVAGEAEDSEEALRVYAEVHPDVVLLDLRLPRPDGVATTRALQRQAPVPRVLILTASYDERLIPEALAAEASGYVLKGGGRVKELIAATRSVHSCQWA